ncbi:hypothetical protein [Duganella sp. BJB476]|uniref:hypothetical protein n=1 Tax=Duganella sp. BJB476 TaxID=1871176 RepID=UPI000E34C1C0|nr:hypothetical protein [Duganella sp. BJB476]RFP36149.1 hypothetical protein D0T21_06860 [Duganella sp. BJB476]
MNERLKWLLAKLTGWEDNYRIPDALMAEFREVRTEVADMVKTTEVVADAPAAPASDPATAPGAGQDPAPAAATPDDMALADRVTALEHMVEALVAPHLGDAAA